MKRYGFDGASAPYVLRHIINWFCIGAGIAIVIAFSIFAALIYG